MERTINLQQMQDFANYMLSQELSQGTCEKYSRDIRNFAAWQAGREVTRESAARWKQELLDEGYAPVTVNSMLAALNTFFRFAGWEDCRLKFLKIQRQMFRDRSKELTEAEYRRLVHTAEKSSDSRLVLLLETLGGTGVRVSEVRYITVEAAQEGRAEILLKGKIRTILLPTRLCRKLLEYARKNKIASGEIFLTKGGRGLSRKQIWAQMKALCEKAGVEKSKVFPHNLRHLFATVFYQACKDIARLADVLGHASVETTRIYLLTTGREHVRQLDRMKLVC